MATKVCQKLLYCDSTLEVNLLVCNVIVREIEKEKVQTPPTVRRTQRFQISPTALQKRRAVGVKCSVCIYIILSKNKKILLKICIGDTNTI